MEISTLTLSAYVSHVRTGLLDRLIENATAHEPNARPTMAEVAAELHSWLTPTSASTSSMDLSDLAMRITATSTPRRRLEAHRLKLIKEHEEFLNSLMYLLQPLENRIAAAFGVSQIGFRLHSELLVALRDHREKARGITAGPLRDEPKLTGLAVNIMARILGNDRIMLLSGIGVTVYEDRLTILEAAHLVRVICPNEQSCPPGMIWVRDVASEIIWSQTETSRLGSAHIEHACAELANGLMANLRPAIERFTILLETL